MTINFSILGLNFTARVVYIPEDYNNPMELDIISLNCGRQSAEFLLDSNISEEIYSAAAEAAAYR